MDGWTFTEFHGTYGRHAYIRNIGAGGEALIADIVSRRVAKWRARGASALALNIGTALLRKALRRKFGGRRR